MKTKQNYMAWLHDSLWRAYDVLALSILPQFENFQVGSEWSHLWPFFLRSSLNTDAKIKAAADYFYGVNKKDF